MEPAISDYLLMITSMGGRICVGMVFCVAAISKMRHWPLLSGVVSNYRLLPNFAVGPVSLLLPPIEAILGVTLLMGFWRPWSGIAAITVLSVFALAMGINLLRGRSYIDCGCAQSYLKQTLRWTFILRNAVLVALVIPSISAISVTPANSYFAGLFAGFLFAMLYFVFNALSALAGPARGSAEHPATV